MNDTRVRLLGSIFAVLRVGVAACGKTTIVAPDKPTDDPKSRYAGPGPLDTTGVGRTAPSLADFAARTAAEGCIAPAGVRRRHTRLREEDAVRDP